MKYGLSQKNIAQIQAVFVRFPQVEKAVLYGSRAKGNFKTGSDIDLTLHGKDLTLKILYKIEMALDDLLLPYTIDLSVFEKLTNPAFIEHIQRVGLVFYERGVEVVGDGMREGWEVKRLGDVLKLEYGKPLPRPKRKHDGAYPVYGANGEKSRSDEFYCDKPSIIVGRKGSAGAINLSEDKFWPLDVTYFVTFDSEKYDLAFLYYLLLCLELPKLAKGVKPGINRNDVYSIQCPIPPLPEQQRIVAILDEVLAGVATAVAHTERNLQNAREVFESYLNGVFANPGEGWEERTLGEVVDFFNGFSFKSKDAVVVSNTQVIRIGNLYQNRLNLDRRPVFYPDKFADRYQEYLLEKNDLIISLTGTTGKKDYGFTVKIPETKRNLLLNQRITKIIVLDEEQTIRGFLRFFLLSRFFLNKLYKTAKGTRQANLSTKTMKSLPIRLPKPDKQKDIVAELDTLFAEVQRLEAIYRQKLDALDELKKSILQRAFSGEL